MLGSFSGSAPFRIPLLVGLLATAGFAAESVKIDIAATFPDRQVTGVAVTPDGRMFVNFPFWSDTHTLSVAEVLPDGSLKAFPDEAWNKKDGDPKSRWVCVQTVYVDKTGSLWILDPASPKMEGVLPGGAKLVRFDLAANKVAQVISFDDTVAPSKSYLNDVRVEQKTRHAFITESGTGALITVNLEDGKARRLLGNSAATRAEPEVKLVVDGFNLVEPKTGLTPQIHADGIALDEDKGLLYFHALTARSLYRISTTDLLNPKLTDAELGKKLEKVAATSPCDGMIIGRDGALYLTAFDRNAIEVWDGKSKKARILVQDDRLQWPDTFAWGPDGALFVTTSQIHRQPKYHGGVSKQKGPYHVYRLNLPNQ
ncbi:MAG TPA: L-dopachrome tautomerase-related protein [Prosthecobacter sp.]|nr:L-dopachrome tautomerase-related protein [Prosthecobacter sp.]